MTVVHVINYTIPIAFMIFFGFWLDRMCKPAAADVDETVGTDMESMTTDTNAPILADENKTGQ
ncbi:hypothetical protein D1B31_07490 [Neobacillus notoginsengisoli]|uniref:Uncharacterized protein n=1 Tax=Neobacillus notoginsengisoli TaxID=1578198 RepID=A0A417YW41_9BACI|nr:hypothetical protein [Neobacillus notoginsengisoli]RHW41556.1 hypothetical protein D1B31_07490 [Neobacillus notoginsengisoli]